MYERNYIFYQKVVEDSLKHLPMHTLHKEFRFVDPKIVLTKSNISLDCTIMSLNYLNKKEVIFNELGQIKNYFSDSEKTELPTDVLQFWNYMYELNNFNDCGIFKNIAELALNVLCLPHGNASVERIFSMMADIKTKKRNQLKPSTVKALLRIKLDMSNENMCCLTTTITEQHLKKFNQHMYNDEDESDETDHESDS